MMLSANEKLKWIRNDLVARFKLVKWLRNCYKLIRRQDQDFFFNAERGDVPAQSLSPWLLLPATGDFTYRFIHLSSKSVLFLHHSLLSVIIPCQWLLEEFVSTVRHMHMLFFFGSFSKWSGHFSENLLFIQIFFLALHIGAGTSYKVV